MTYTAICIIYNPNSTGDSVKNAKEFKAKLSRVFSHSDIKLCETEYRGHATELAYQIALASKRPLIISASGDGGYNEVVNGAMQAQNEGAHPICAVLASGNANDHSRNLQDSSLLKSVTGHKLSQIDLLKAVVEIGNERIERYAHSYIGLGLTPVVAVELNKTKLNSFKEMLIVLRTFYKYQPFKIKRKNKVLKLDSIIFANISQMAKVLTISKNAKPDDGLFEIVSFPHKHKIALLKKVAQATLTGLNTSKKYKSYEFRVLKNMPVQLDGEVIRIKKGSLVRITAEHKLLETII